MSYQVSARKWRPQSFNEVMGQGHVVKTLKNAIQNNRVGHAYLFSGSRGVGKTTIARIFAKALNCAKGSTPEPCNNCEMCREITDGFCTDVIEIDGASNTGVDDVRELRENVKYASAKGRYKVYIIDEVHMLSKSAFNALLKTLEEPPAHVIFIFATTEPNRIPETIISRCQYFEFKRISINDAVEQLFRITEREGIKVSREILTLIAKSAEGSMRDALVSLDQIISFSGDVIKDEDVKIILGLVGREVFGSIIECVKGKNIQGILSVVKDLSTRGIDLRVFCKEFLEYLRNLVVVKITEDPAGITGLSAMEVERLKSESKDIGTEELQQMFNIILKTEAELRYASQPELVLEMALIKLTQIGKVLVVDEILKRLDNLSVSASNREIKNEVANSSTLTPDTYTSLWASIKESVGSKKPSLGGILEGMRFLKIRGDEIILSFIEQGSESYYKEKIELHKEIIGDTIREITGRNLKIVFDTALEKESLKENASIKQAHTEIERWKREKIQEVLDIIPGVVVREMSGEAQGGVV